MLGFACNILEHGEVQVVGGENDRQAGISTKTHNARGKPTKAFLNLDKTKYQVNSLQKKNLQKIAEELSADKRLRFDRGEIEQLLIMFTTLTSGNKKALIERTQFRFSKIQKLKFQQISKEMFYTTHSKWPKKS